MSRQAAAKNDEPLPVRLPNTTAIVPIVYGSIAFFMGKKASEEHTHRWTLYVRGPNDEDLSVAISKVIFHLHPSFPQPVRELDKPPFEVTEKGWGEFEATIRILWHDANERATVLTHFIKLYPTIPANSNSNNNSSSSGNKQEPVIHEFYDEVVFTDPTESFHEQLQRWSVLPKIKSQEENIHEYLPTYGDDDDFKAFLEAERFLQLELTNVKDRIMKADTESQDLDSQLMALTHPPPANVAGIPPVTQQPPPGAKHMNSANQPPMAMSMSKGNMTKGMPNNALASNSKKQMHAGPNAGRINMTSMKPTTVASMNTTSKKGSGSSNKKQKT